RLPRAGRPDGVGTGGPGTLQRATPSPPRLPLAPRRTPLALRILVGISAKSPNMQGLPAVRTGVLLDIHNLAVKQRVCRPPETHRGSPAHLLARCYPIPQKEPV